jgi:hypothetical protein
MESDVEAMARMRDLSRLQLANEREIEMSELVHWVNGVHDSQGWLVVVNKLCLRNSWTVALAIKYQTHSPGRSRDVAVIGGGDIMKDMFNLNPLASKDITFTN